MTPDRIQLIAELVYPFVKGSNPHTLFHTNRCTLPNALARQMTIYLAHVVSPTTTLSRLGQLFRRDRTTISYACAKIEDMRDNPAVDAYLTHIENVLTNEPSTITNTARAAQ